MERTLVVKVGTSTLCDAAGRIDRDYVEELAAELVGLADDGKRVVLVTSGAIRAGCERLGWGTRPRALPLKQAAAAVGQGRLMELYAAAFGRRGRAVGQVLLTRHDAADRSRYVNARNTLSTLLTQGVIPIVNENDTVAVEEIRFGDNDTLAAQVSVLAHAGLLVLLTDVEGLLDASGALIARVGHVDASIHALCGRPGAAGTGGMATKLEAAEIACAAGIRTCIVRGRPASVIGRLVSGERVGTEFLPAPRRLAGRKHWIAYGSHVRGALAVHPLARAALVEQNRSLLPAGVLRVRGPFERGDIVSLADEEGRVFGRGMVSCDSEEIERVMGLHTLEAQRRLGRPEFREVVHHDNLVLLARPAVDDGDPPLARAV